MRLFCLFQLCIVKMLICFFIVSAINLQNTVGQQTVIHKPIIVSELQNIELASLRHRLHPYVPYYGYGHHNHRHHRRHRHRHYNF